jgi:hypothetical protein
MRCTLFFIAATFLAGSTSAQTPPLEELHRLVDGGEFGPALQKITVALQLKGPAAKLVDRYQLYMLKGECHLRLKATRLAGESYAAAAKAAASDHDRLLAAAHEMLIRNSRAFAYTPKPPPPAPAPAAPASPPAPPVPALPARPAPIDILDPASRKRAFAAMLADELAANDAKLRAAQSAHALPPIAACFAPLQTMEGLELAATGDAPKVTALRGKLIDTAKKAVAEALRALSKRLGEIDKSANTFVENYQESVDLLGRPAMVKMYKKKGLSDADSKELSATNATCDKIPPALAELAKGLGADDKTFEPFSDEAARIRREVDRVLDIDYQRTYRELPK